MSNDKRVLIHVAIMVDDPPGQLDEFADRVSAALAASGVANYGAVPSKWQTWESLVIEAMDAGEFDDDDESEEANAARSAAEAKVTSAPSNNTWPASGNSRPAIVRSSVVLPEPDGPSSASSSPSAISRSTLFSAG